MRFEGSEIYNSKQNGPYYVSLNLHKGTCSNGGAWISGWEPNTDIIADYSNFSKPIAFIGNITDYGSVNGDLLIGVNVTVAIGYGGDYRVNCR